MAQRRSIPVGRVKRVAPLVALTGRTAGDAVVASLQRRIRGVDNTAAVHERAADRYAAVLGRSRGVLMKAGQILSFFAPSDGATASVYSTALARLQSDAPPMAPEEAAEVVRAELGAPPEEIFAEFDAVPFAAASIGQVHRATLHDGRVVAVKVQYPGVDEAIRADLANVELLGTFLRLGASVMPDMPKIDTRALAEEVSARIGEEIDYRTEAANQIEFADAYRGHPFIRIPEVISELSTARVLTMEYVDGMRWAEAAEQDKELRDRWGEVIYRFVWGSMRRLRAANADPHPGNYLFHPDGTVTFLDFGCVKRFSAEQVLGLQAMERAGNEGDPVRLWHEATALGFTTGGRAPSPEQLADWLDVLWRPSTGEQPFTYTPEFGMEATRQVMSPFGTHAEVLRRIDLPPDFTFFLRTDAGLTAILCRLGATGYWRSIVDEYDGVAPPATELGHAEIEFWGAIPAGGPR
ncbi:putative unusual protein kinase regulating ubiquinone biosynthesis (AarF/ABC1/UbiB family) [Herbihabitans rhizosphaerae]|uniref:Putative unusual protein kinase regulating ubiquinone biosynthesis (AarF/ABC1/UbiB family) n=1 Tax=Herbihabitans rhizosphaerae TaxID=1872711 RepID=A0A4Q7L5T6_9PSEU|nr:AarF/ABC1/UbiB kinase family protein [Herbihabitans rhizosphaerae]RZS44705.1 putative unusual protein kinase regulating ubiquinone biosynthesis (AarF/ABC1/UbiB family) [Herbihabitans rhizosphaerae]